MKFGRFTPKLHICIERWKYYLPLDIYVSNMGNIKDVNGEQQRVCASDGYLFYKGKKVHRIVLEAWRPVPNYAKLTVDHINHNTRDNSLSNLEWVTAEENNQRALDDSRQNNPQDAGIVYVILNGVKLPMESAQKIILKNKCFTAGAAKVKEIFQKVRGSDKPVEFGGYTIQRCEG